MNIQSCKTLFKHLLQNSLLLAATAGMLLVVSSCATQAPVKVVAEEVQELVWPNPPEQAVIRYVGFVRDVEEIAIKERPRFADLLAGKETKESAKTLNKPFGVHGDKHGRLFVTDTALGALIVFDRKTDKVERWGEVGMGALTKPIGVSSDASGNIYVCDVVDRRVVVYDPEGKYINAFGGKAIFEAPVAIAINDDLQRIYVLDSKQHKMVVFDMQGKHLFSVGQKGGRPGDFMFPTGIAIDPDGRLFISDTMNFRVQILDPDGVYIKSFGQIGQNVGDFNRPKGIALDRDGHIYIVDASFGNFQIFNEDGQLLLFIGQNGQAPGQFLLPTGIHIDPQGTIYVADQINHRVQIFEYLGTPVIEDTRDEEAVE